MAQWPVQAANHHGTLDGTITELAFALIRLLVAGAGSDLTNAGTEHTSLPGFLCDMNRLIPKVHRRFLLEWLDDATLTAQCPLQGVFR